MKLGTHDNELLDPNFLQDLNDTELLDLAVDYNCAIDPWVDLLIYRHRSVWAVEYPLRYREHRLQGLSDDELLEFMWRFEDEMVRRFGDFPVFRKFKRWCEGNPEFAVIPERDRRSVAVLRELAYVSAKTAVPQ